MAGQSTPSGPKAKAKIHKIMEEYKERALKSGSGKTVDDRKQAVAIALREARDAEAKK